MRGLFILIGLGFLGYWFLSDVFFEFGIIGGIVVLIAILAILSKK
jgi:hypothetical protein